MTMQIAILLGGVAGIGILVIVDAVMPSTPRLSAGLARLDPVRQELRPGGNVASVPDLKTRVGISIDRRLSRWLPIRVPDRDLSMIQRSRAEFLAEKVSGAVAGFVMPYLVGGFAAVMGLGFGGALPVLASLAAAGLGWVMPDLGVRSKARLAREAFVNDISTYIDLVAQERLGGGAGTAEALTAAAEVGDSPAFVRLKQELARARWNGLQPWDALDRLAQEVAIPEIAEVSNIMRLSGEHGAPVYDQLRALAANLRRAQMALEKSRAGAATERMRVPQTLLGAVFLAVIATPALMTFMST